MTDYGQYHNDIWDLIEFADGTVDVRIKYLADEKLSNHLKVAIDNLHEAKLLLIKKAENERPSLGDVT